RQAIGAAPAAARRRTQGGSAEQSGGQREEQSMSMVIGSDVKKGAWVALALLLGLSAGPVRAAARSTAAGTASWQEREQERRDREQEARERAQEHAERLEELYDDGREALDDDHYEQAAEKFTALAGMNGPQTDAALYWKAYAENKLGR